LKSKIFWIALLGLTLLGKTTLIFADTSGFLSLRNGFGARSMVLGGPPPADGDAESLYWNPAAIAYQHSSQVLAAHYFWLGETYIEQLAITLPPVNNFYFGGAASVFIVPPFNSTLEESAEPGSGLEGALWGSAALRLNTALALGASIKFIFNRWMNADSLGAGLDLGAVYTPGWPGWNFQISLQNLGGTTELDKTSDPLPSTALAGITYSWDIIPDLIVRPNPSFSLDREGIFRMGAGLEIQVMRVLALRCGTLFRPQNALRWGAGMSYTQGAMQFDYGFQALPDLGLAHLLAVRYRLNPVASIPAKAIVLDEPENEGQTAFQLEAASKSPIAAWRLQIQTPAGQHVKKFEGKNTLPKRLVWKHTDHALRKFSIQNGFKYIFEVTNTTRQTGRDSGIILSESLLEAPKLNALPSEKLSEQGKLLNFSFSQMPTKMQPKEWTLNFSGPEGKILKSYSAVVGGPKDLAGTGSDAIEIPLDASRYSLTFITADKRQQTIQGPVVRLNAGPILTAQTPLPPMELPFVFENLEGAIQSWSLILRDPEQKRIWYEAKGKGLPPLNQVWQTQGQTPPPSDQPYTVELILRDEYGIEWRREIPVPSVEVKTSAKKPGQPQMKIDQILFDFDQAGLKREMIAKLRAAAVILKNYPNAKAVVKGHTDDRGSDRYNLSLSQKRALAVKRYLIEDEGLVELKRLQIKGFADKYPIASGSSEKAREKNRRVEVEITLPIKAP
jgi:outer membrane protein OmpA-like peptidoglycan-associated protein